MPAWDDDYTLTTDPQLEISLIYYPDRQGLEDLCSALKLNALLRPYRPDTRNCLECDNIEVIERDGDNYCPF